MASGDLDHPIPAVGPSDLAGLGRHVDAMRERLLAEIDEASLSPGASFQWLADQLGDTGDQFLTGVIIEVDVTAGRLRYVSAGHPPILVSDGRSVSELGPTGPLLGPLAGHWADEEAELPPQGSLAIYSDGLIESHGADGAQFGMERLAALLVAEATVGDPESVAAACTSELARLQGGHDPDDITLVVVGNSSRPQDGVGGANHGAETSSPSSAATRRLSASGTDRGPPPAPVTQGPPRVGAATPGPR